MSIRQFSSSPVNAVMQSHVVTNDRDFNIAYRNNTGRLMFAHVSVAIRFPNANGGQALVAAFVSNTVSPLFPSDYTQIAIIGGTFNNVNLVMNQILTFPVSIETWYYINFSNAIGGATATKAIWIETY
jgi:hypothetical protein